MEAKIQRRREFERRRRRYGESARNLTRQEMNGGDANFAEGDNRLQVAADLNVRAGVS